MMRGTIFTAVAAAFAVLVFAGGKPAAAAPASAALAYGETQAGLVEQVGRKYRYSRKYRRGPYYRGYAYRSPYWGRPYGYRYPYYRRGPGVSLWFGF